MRQNMETYNDNINLLQSSETKWYQNRYIIISIIILGLCVLLGIFYRVYLNFFQKEGLQDINDISNVDIPVVDMTEPEDMTEVPTSSDSSAGSSSGSAQSNNNSPNIECAANFGSTTPTDGSSGIVDARYVCPQDRPLCKDYMFNVKWGNCESDMTEVPTSSDASNTYDVDTVNEEEEITTPEPEYQTSTLPYLSISEEGNWMVPASSSNTTGLSLGKKIYKPHAQQKDPASVDFNVWKTYMKCPDIGYPRVPCTTNTKHYIKHGHRVCNPQGSKNCIDFVDGSINCNPEPSQTLYYESSLLNPCTVEGPVNQYKGIIHILPRWNQPPIPKR